MFFKTRLTLFLIIPTLLLGACEKRPDTELPSTSFYFTRPNQDCKPEVSTQKVCIFGDEIEKVKIRYAGIVRSSNFRLKVNGVPFVTTLEAGLDSSADSKEGFVANNNIAFNLSRLRNVLAQGDNTLEAQKLYVNREGFLTDKDGELLKDENKANITINETHKIVPTDVGKEVEYSQTFNFFFDNQAPRVIVKEIVPSAPNPDGTTAFLDTITVSGVLEDVSSITKLKFTYPGGSVDLKKVENVPAIGNNQFQNKNGAKKASFIVVLPNYPDVNSVTSTPHFSYTVEDEPGHVREESFYAPGAVVKNNFALQLNDSLPAYLDGLSSVAFQNILNIINSDNTLGIAEPLLFDNKRHAQPGELMSNPEISNKPCVLSEELPGVKQCFPGKENGGKYPKGTIVWIYPDTGISPLCSNTVFDKRYGVTHCMVFITNVIITGPKLDISFKDTKSASLQMKTGVWLDQTKVNFEVAGVSKESSGFSDQYRYKGSLTASVKIPRFRVGTGGYDLFPNGSLIGVSRNGGIFLEQTDLIKVPEVNADCRICSPLMNPFLIAFYVLGADYTGNDINDSEDLINAVGGFLEKRLGPVIDEFLEKYADNLNPVRVNESTPEIYNRLFNSATYDVYRDNGHLLFNGGYGALPEFLVDSPSLGSIHDVQGKYVHPPVFKNPPRWNPDERADFSFAMSANSINQWLLANHQSESKPLDFEITGADLELLDLGITGLKPNDLLSITFKTNEAPYVILSSDEKCDFNICWSELYAPGHVKLVVNQLDFSVFKGTDKLVDANIDLKLEFYINANNGMPTIKLINNSTLIRVNNLVQPAAMPKSLFSYNLAKVLEGFVSTDNASFKNNVLGMGIGKNLHKIDITKLAGIGGSGPTCDGPSTDGNICIKGNPSIQIPFKALLKGFIPRDYALFVKWMTVEKDSSYLSVGLHVITAPACQWNDNEKSSLFHIFRLSDGSKECQI